MTTVITNNRTALTGIAGIALAAALFATGFASVAPQIARDSAANAAPVVTGQLSLVDTLDATSGGAFAGE